MESARILIVEDDAIQAAHKEDTLKMMGYQVIGLASTGKQAIEMALTQKPDVILMDIRLRGKMTGIQAAEAIRSQVDIPIIYLTAFTDALLLEQAKLTEPYAYLAKPVQDPELHASLEMALYKHRSEQRMQHLNQVLRAVRDINHLITHEHDPEQLIEQACQILLRTRGYRLVWIGKVEKGHKRVIPWVRAGQGTDYLDHVTITWDDTQTGRGPTGTALRTRKPVVCNDISTEASFQPWRDAAIGRGFASSAAAPILHQKRLLGALNVYADQSQRFNQEEIDLLMELARDLGLALTSIEQENERKKAEESIRLNETRLKILFELGQQRFDTEKELIDYALEEAVRLTDSEIGYFHFIQADQVNLELFSWSSKVFENCIASTDRHYPLDKAGVWADCVRLKQPVIHNDYPNLPDRKGYPEGHSPILRHMSVPITDNDQLVAITGVANKRAAYEELDALQLQLFMDGLWRLIVRKRAEQFALQEQDRAQQYLDIAGVVILALDQEGKVALLNRRGHQLLGYMPGELQGVNWFETCLPKRIRNEVKGVYRKLMAGELETVEFFENPVLTKSGQERLCAWHNTLLRNNTSAIIGALSSGEDITERRRAEAAIKKRAIQLELLNEIAYKIGQAHAMEDVLQRTVELTQQLFKYQHIGIFTLDQDRKNLVMRANAGEFTALFPEGHKLSLGQGMVGWVCKHGRSLLANDVNADPQYINLYPGILHTRSELTVPIQLAGEVLGVLDIQSDSLNAFDENDQIVMETLANQISVALENARLVQSMQGELAEKEVLFREIHHRVKNNLEVIISLADLQARSITDPLAFQSIRELQERVRTIALVHEDLYRSKSLAHIQTQAYFQRLTDHLFQAFGSGGIDLQVQAADLSLTIDTAIPCGLIVTELVTNAIKHAFPSGPEQMATGSVAPTKQIRVRFFEKGERQVLEVCDNGVGLPPELDWQSTRSLGLRLVSRLAGQLHGSLDVSVENGTRFQLTFPCID